MVKIYGIRNCDTMKKAFAWLDTHGIGYELHDYKKAGVPLDRLERWMQQVGWEKLVNTRGPTFRKLPAAQTANLDERRALGLLTANSSAIKRPVIESGRTLLIGFDADAYARALK